MPDPGPTAPDAKPRPSRSDLVLSVLLPLAVIALGVALSTGSAGSFVEMCLQALR